MTAASAGEAPALPASGLLHGAAAYTIWGFLPIYFKIIEAARPMEILGHRILWSLLLMMIILAVTGALREFRQTLKNRRVMLAMAGSGALIGANWTIYIFAVTGGHILGASLGYFLNPLVNVVLGVVVLKEKLRRTQLAAICIAAAGVIILGLEALDTLWVSLSLAFSFAFYGLIRKLAPVGPRQGLAAETLLLSPFAVIYLFWLTQTGQGEFGRDASLSVMIAFSGIATSVPLLLFASAARQIPLSTLGLLQYLAPSIQFLTGVFVYHETLNKGQVASFGLIWIGLIIFTWDSLRTVRRARMA